MPVPAVSLQRKKSLPDVAQPIQLSATAPLSREEVSKLSSLRREEIRRQIDESERLRANPLLYLVSPQVKVSVTRTRTPFFHLALVWFFYFLFFSCQRMRTDKRTSPHLRHCYSGFFFLMVSYM